VCTPWAFPCRAPVRCAYDDTDMVHIRRGDINRYGHGGFILRVQRIVATIQCGAGATLLLLPVHHPTTPSGRTQVRTSAARALVTFREMEALAFWAERRPRRVSRAGRQSWAGTTVETAGKVRRKAPLAAPAFACRREAALAWRRWRGGAELPHFRRGVTNVDTLWSRLRVQSRPPKRRRVRLAPGPYAPRAWAGI
jgi:hypothetical protein